MSRVEIKETVNAPAKKVWDLIKGFGDIHKWAGGGIQSCELEGDGVGAVRTISMPGGGRIQERLEAYDEGERCFQYSIIGQSPLPLADYLATVKVLEDGAARCVIDWSGEFQPAGTPEDEAKKLVAGIYTGAIGSVRKTLGVD